MTESYVPGVCNIGPAEIRRRRAVGIAGSAAAAGALALVLATGAPRPVRMLVAAPATMGAAGFLQAAAHFCSGYGMRGVIGFGAAAGDTGSVEDEEDRRADRRRARALLGGAAAIGVSAAVLALTLP